MEELKKELKEIQNFVDRLKSTNSNNDKINIIIATTWPSKVPVWDKNLKSFPKDILDKIYLN